MMISIDSIINNGQIARVHEIKGSSTISHIDETCRQYFLFAETLTQIRSVLILRQVLWHVLQ